MPLTVELKIPRPDLLVQENPACQLVITHAGGPAHQVPDLVFNPHIPALRIVDVKTGLETIRQPKPPLGAEKQRTLAPGGTLKSEFLLGSRVEFTVPGEFDVSAIVHYDVTKAAESAPVRVTVRTVAPKSLSIVTVQGGYAPVQYGFSINASEDPPQIVRHLFDVATDGGVHDARSVAPAHLRAVPVPSAPANRTVAHTHWVAWSEANTIYATHFDPAAGASPVKRWRIPTAAAELVHPLHIDKLTDAVKRPAGAALVRLSDGLADASELQVLLLTAGDNPDPRARAPLPGPAPLWMMSHERADGVRFVTYIQAAAAGPMLSYTRWPDQLVASDPPRRLEQWGGQNAAFVAAGATMGRDSTLFGATLLVHNPQTNPTYSLAPWSIDPKGQFTAAPLREVAGPGATPVAAAVVRVGPTGAPAALLRDHTGVWSVYDPRTGLKPAPTMLLTTRFPLDLAFLREAEPVLIAGVPMGGYEIYQLNGDHLPHSCG